MTNAKGCLHNAKTARGIPDIRRVWIRVLDEDIYIGRIRAAVSEFDG
jgi:hypothetical protein